MTRRSLFKYLVGVAAGTVLARLPLSGSAPVDFEDWLFRLPPPIGVKWWQGTSILTPEEMRYVLGDPLDPMFDPIPEGGLSEGCWECKHKVVFS